MLKKLVKTICDSLPSEWHLIRLTPSIAHGCCTSHESLAVFKTNPKVSIAFGAREKDLETTWLSKITGKLDGPTTVRFGDVLLNGQLIYRARYVQVAEEGKAYLPLPTSTMVIPSDYADFVALLHLIDLPATRYFDFVPFLKQSGMTTDEQAEWPEDL